MKFDKEPKIIPKSKDPLWNRKRKLFGLPLEYFPPVHGLIIKANDEFEMGFSPLKNSWIPEWLFEAYHISPIAIGMGALTIKSLFPNCYLF